MIEYVTNEWSVGTGGFAFNIPKTGWYFLNAHYASVSGSATSIQFQVHKNRNMLVASGRTAPEGSYCWNGTMPIENICTIEHFEAGDVITPYIHTSVKGMVINTSLDCILIKEE